MNRLSAAACGLLAAWAAQAFPTYQGPAGSSLPPQGVVCISMTGVVQDCAYQDAPFQGVVAMTPDTAYAPARSIGANCAAAGNLSVTFADGSTLVVPVGVGWQTFPFAVTAVNSGGTTATCAFANLK